MVYQTLYIDDVDWEPSGPDEDPAARRTAHIQLNGCLRFHFEAFRVKVDDQGIQVADTISEEVRTWFADYSVASSEQSHPFQTIELDLQDYVVFGTA